MTDASLREAPLEQVLSQFQSESGHEDLTGLSQADIKRLATDAWVWASGVAEGEQAVRVRHDPAGSDGALARTVLEATGPDMPFLVDSALGECATLGYEVRTLFHPVVRLEGGQRQSVIQVHLRRMTEAEAERLVAGTKLSLAHNAEAVRDYAAMRARMQEESERLARLRHIDPNDRDETVSFLQWLSRDHFVFLGCRTYQFETGMDGHVLPEEPIMVEGSNLGILRDEDLNVLSRDAEPLVLTPEIGAFLESPFPMIVAKSTLESRVHRRVAADYIGVKRYDDQGRVVGEVRFLGLFTAEAYEATARSIPFLRRRVSKIIDGSGATPGGYSEKALSNLLETWPRDELFQTRSSQMLPVIMGALHMRGRPRTRLFLVKDQFDRSVIAIVYVRRDAYDSSLRQKMAELLEAAFDGQLVRFRPYFETETHVRVHFEINLEPGHPEPDAAALETEIARMARTWDQSLREALMSADLDDGHRDSVGGFVGAFSAAYREAFTSEEAIADIRQIARLSTDQPTVARAYRYDNDEPDKVRVKMYARNGSIPLSACVPIFERMGLFVSFETGYPVRPVEMPAPDTYWVHDLSMRSADGSPMDLAKVGAALEEAVVAVWSGQAENDGFNRLVLAAGASWREAALVRALAAYRRQSGMEQPQAVQESAFAAYPEIVRMLLNLFAARFDPSTGQDLTARAAIISDLRAEIDLALRDVSALADDQVLRHVVDLILAVQRTNFYQRDARGVPDSFISFKIASRELEAVPEPKPYREIFTHSPKVEGVHLRFGPIARGGLRWSDRESDYRTEILGLVKAQQVKNAVIVPVGSKGGFFPKQLADRSDRDAWFESGRDAYKEFITALLGVTDNLVEGDTVHPENTVVWDGEDAYLVVAADKGTATFSDTANEISVAKGHWLGDAFASGGSAGYDHKKMGITARGAWEAVKRHFREMGTDIQTEPFSVIGVGDMSGDVFGNGMLLSEQTRLVAAFNHMHIFIDPNPADVAASYAERKRLFDMGRSSWSDYNPSLLSDGGGIFERSAKSIALSDPIKALVGLQEDSVTPDELIHALLKAEVDLLWFGGIGTYIKAEHETHADAGDRANDAIRVNGDEVKAKVVGEGANLGLTQAGRIELAARGGRVNTDAIDNSAGVDSSDHEVNIKILASEAIRLGNLDEAARNGLLADMTDRVAAHVLRHNYDQTAALTTMEAAAAQDHEALERLMVYLEERGVLNRELEGLPDTGEMKVRADQNKPLYRPELSVLLAWSKITLFNDLIESDLPDDPFFHSVLKGYFPDPICDFEEAIAVHPLKREIIATIVANRILDMAGPVTLLRMRELVGVAPADAAKALEAARVVLNYDEFKQRVDELDNVVAADLQTEFRMRAATAMVVAGCWFATEAHDETISEAVARTQMPLNEFKSILAEVHAPFPAARIERIARQAVKRGAPEDLARWAGAMNQFAYGLFPIEIAARNQISVKEAATCFYEVGDMLRLDRLRGTARDGLTRVNYWDRVASRRLISELFRVQAAAVEDALAQGGAKQWVSGREDARDSLLAELGAISRDKGWSFAKFALSVDAVRQFLRF